MTLRAIPFGSISHADWDGYVSLFSEATYQHSSWWLDYHNAIFGADNAKSCILLEDGAPIAVCPLAFVTSTAGGANVSLCSFLGSPNPLPAIADLNPTRRRRVVEKVYGFIHDLAVSKNVVKISFQRHPVNRSFMEGSRDMRNSAELLSRHYLPQIKNTIIVDLGKGEENLLLEMTKYQRKHIVQSRNQGLKVNSYRGDSEPAGTAFDNFKLAHFKSAGRWTRPMASWDAMKKLLLGGSATLFAASIDGKEISYLFSGESGRFSFGWSQANLDEHEKEYSPRHLLEWECMRSYISRGFLFYEVGIRYGSAQFDHVPTQKEVTISRFKERYGGDLYPLLYFERFFDRDYFSKTCAERMNGFLASSYFNETETGVDDE